MEYISAALSVHGEGMERMRHTVSLKENHLFRRLYSKGKSAACPTLAVYVRPNHHAGNRLGITVGSKVGKAVRRNKVRRRIREAYRIHEKKIKPGFDIVAVARVRAVHAPYAQVEHDLLRLLDKLGVYEREAKGR